MVLLHFFPGPATQNQQSQSSLPPVSYIKAIDVWMSSCTVFVFASLLQFGVVNHFMNDAPISKDMTGYSVEDLSNYDDKKVRCYFWRNSVADLPATMTRIKFLIDINSQEAVNMHTVLVEMEEDIHRLAESLL